MAERRSRCPTPKDIIRFVVWLVVYVLQKVAVFIQNTFYTEKIIFNTVWEDPRLDMEGLKLSDKDVIMTITSAGCNALHMMIEAEPEHIYCIDRNPCQNALLELKISAIKNLQYKDFWILFGTGRYPNFSTGLYRKKLRADLSSAAQKFWDKHATYFDGKGFRNSFYWRGTSGMMAYCVGVYLWLIPGLYSSCVRLFNAKTKEEQKEIYELEIKNKMWNFLFNSAIKSSVYLSTCGIPIAQQKLLAEESGGAHKIGDWIREQMEYLFTEVPIHDNYFWRVYLLGEYTKDCCPEYLKEENFGKLKGLVDRVTVHTLTIADFLREHNKHDITRFNLLDHQDWMAERPEMLTEEWNQILENSAEEDVKFMWRSASPTTPFIGETEVVYKGKKTKLKNIIQMNSEVTEKLHHLDRVHTYTSWHIADLVGFDN